MWANWARLAFKAKWTSINLKLWICCWTRLFSVQIGLCDLKHPRQFKSLLSPMFPLFQLKKKIKNSVKHSKPTRIFFFLQAPRSKFMVSAFAATFNSSTFHQKVHLNLVSYSIQTLKVLLPASPYHLRHCKDHSNICLNPRHSCHLLAHVPGSAVRC